MIIVFPALKSRIGPWTATLFTSPTFQMQPQDRSDPFCVAVDRTVFLCLSLVQELVQCVEKFGLVTNVKTITKESPTEEGDDHNTVAYVR